VGLKKQTQVEKKTDAQKSKNKFHFRMVERGVVGFRGGETVAECDAKGCAKYGGDARKECTQYIFRARPLEMAAQNYQ
jgi:hypothetical protein